MKPSRSLLVSWLLGATVVAVVTFSFEALSARELAAARGPETAAASSVVNADAPACPAANEAARCPATGATAHSATASGRCPATGATAHSATASGRCPATGATAGSATASGRCPVSGATATPASPSGRCPAGGDASGLLKTGLRV